MAKVKGFDISSDAIEQARDRWPTLEFSVADIRDPQENADIIFTSHTIEHVQDPVSTIMRLREHCQVLVVIVPTITDEKHGGHIGAMTTEELAVRLQAELGDISATEFLTLRHDMEHDTPLPEASNLMVIKGTSKCSK
jgi:trans-aconitate methyltransferase